MTNNKKYKLIGFWIILFALYFLLWFLLNYFLFDNSDWSITGRLIMGGVVSVFVISWMLVVLLLSDFKKYIWLPLFGLSFSPFLFFFRQTGVFFVSFIALISFLVSCFSLQKAKALYIKFSTRAYFNVGIGELFFGLMIILLASFYCFNLQNREPIEVQEYINDTWFEKGLSLFLEDYESGITVKEYLERSLDDQDIKRAIEQTYGVNISNDEYQRIFSEEKAEQFVRNLEEFGESFGLELTGKEQVKDVVLAYLNNKVNDYVLKEENKHVYAGVKTLALFLIISLVSFVIRFLAIVLAGIWIKLLIVSKVVRVEKKKVDKEVISV